MEKYKKQKPPMSIRQQIINLKELGLIVENEDYAEHILNDISYFRLIKAYSLNLKIRNGSYFDGVTFEQIVELYLFNANFRQLIFAQIEKIEINTRCRVGNYFSEKYGVLGYRECEHFSREDYHKVFLKDIEAEIRRNARAPFVKNFLENYEEGALPFYALVEIFSFGTLSKFYKNMKNEDKKEIAKIFGIGYTYFESWLESIAYVRNICAHYGRLYNAKLAKMPQLYREYSKKGISNNRIFAVLLCMKIIQKADKHWRIFIDEIEMLFDRYEGIDIHTMGFPENWKKMLYI